MFNTKRFKELRKRKKISVDKIAKELDSTKATIYHYQAGTLQPSDDFIEKIADYLQISKKELMIDENLSQNPYKDALVAELKSKSDFLKSENAKLWALVQKLTGADFSDLGKFKGNLEAAVIPLYREYKLAQ